MIRKRLFKDIGIITVAVMLSASIAGCSNVKEKSSTTSESSVATESSIAAESTVASEKTSVTEKDISPFIKGMDDVSVTEGTKDFDPLSSITTDKNIIKGINADTSKADLDKAGKYTVTYNVVVDDDGYNAYKKDVSSYKENFVKATSLTKVAASDTSVAIKKNLTVTAKDDTATEVSAESKAESKAESTAKTESKSDSTKTNTDSSSTTTKNSGTSTKTNSGTTSTTKQNTGTSSTTKQNTGTSGSSQSSGSTSGTTTKPAHTHNWVAQTKVVHHDAEYTTKWVQDSAAWDEPVYENQPVYQKVDRAKCNGCGAVFNTYDEYVAHDDAAMANGDYSHGGYSVFWEEIQTGTQKVQTGTIHHDATGHNEQVLTKAAWDETVTTGYKCSSCGATK